MPFVGRSTFSCVYPVKFSSARMPLTRQAVLKQQKVPKVQIAWYGNTWLPPRKVHPLEAGTAKDKGRQTPYFRCPTVPGLRYFASPGGEHAGRKWIWLIVYAACIGLCAFQIRERVRYFFTYPVSMTISVQQLERIRFPSVTICSCNPLLSTTIRTKGNISSDWDKSQIYNFFIANNLSVQQIWEMSGENLQDMLAYVLLHDNISFNLEYDAYTKGTVIYKNSRTYMVYMPTTYKLENIPRRPCVPVAQARACEAHCFDRFYLNGSVQCRLPFMKTVDHYPPCLAQQLESVYSIPVGAKFRHDISSCKCPRPCTDNTFEVQPDVRQQLEPNTSLIHIYQLRPVHQLINETLKYTHISLSGDIGGALGLYLGWCTHTFFELLSFLIRRLFFLIFK